MRGRGLVGGGGGGAGVHPTAWQGAARACVHVQAGARARARAPRHLGQEAWVAGGTEGARRKTMVEREIQLVQGWFQFHSP